MEQVNKLIAIFFTFLVFMTSYGLRLFTVNEIKPLTQELTAAIGADYTVIHPSWILVHQSLGTVELIHYQNENFVVDYQIENKAYSVQLLHLSKALPIKAIERERFTEEDFFEGSELFIVGRDPKGVLQSQFRSEYENALDNRLKMGASIETYQFNPFTCEQFNIQVNKNELGAGLFRKKNGKITLLGIMSSAECEQNEAPYLYLDGLNKWIDQVIAEGLLADKNFFKHEEYRPHRLTKDVGLGYFDPLPLGVQEYVCLVHPSFLISTQNTKPKQFYYIDDIKIETDYYIDLKDSKLRLIKLKTTAPKSSVVKPYCSDLRGLVQKKFYYIGKLDQKKEVQIGDITLEVAGMEEVRYIPKFLYAENIGELEHACTCFVESPLYHDFSKDKDGSDFRLIGLSNMFGNKCKVIPITEATWEKVQAVIEASLKVGQAPYQLGKELPCALYKENKIHFPVNPEVRVDTNVYIYGSLPYNAEKETLLETTIQDLLNPKKFKDAFKSKGVRVQALLEYQEKVEGDKPVRMTEMITLNTHSLYKHCSSSKLSKTMVNWSRKISDYQTLIYFLTRAILLPAEKHVLIILGNGRHSEYILKQDGFTLTAEQVGTVLQMLKNGLYEVTRGKTEALTKGSHIQFDCIGCLTPYSRTLTNAYHLRDGLTSRKRNDQDFTLGRNVDSGEYANPSSKILWKDNHTWRYFLGTSGAVDSMKSLVICEEFVDSLLSDLASTDVSSKNVSKLLAEKINKHYKSTIKPIRSGRAIEVINGIINKLYETLGSISEYSKEQCQVFSQFNKNVKYIDSKSELICLASLCVLLESLVKLENKNGSLTQLGREFNTTLRNIRSLSKSSSELLIYLPKTEQTFSSQFITHDTGQLFYSLLTYLRPVFNDDN